MPLDVIMPALGMAQETGLIVAWHKQPGDPVAKGDALFEVETDKATMEVEAQGDGFLTNVTAGEGADVPVGHVIARISQSAESAVALDVAPGVVSGEDVAMPPAPGLPAGKDVIMPTLGMTQDTGLLIAWHKAAGDAVGADDILFEVETDKSTVEVNAGADGYIAALLVGEGEEVPVGQTIAIISIEVPANPIARKAADAPIAATSVVTPNVATEPPNMPKPATNKTAPSSSANGRVLASPKVRRLAHEQGLDLGLLVAAGHKQPFHVSDLSTLKALSAETMSASSAAQSSSRLTAEVATEGFSGFAAWACETANLTDTSALLAGFCAASMDKDAVVAVECFNTIKTYAGSAQLSAVKFSEDTPQIRLRDLRFCAITTVQVGAEDIPTLTLTRNGAGVSITLEFAVGQLSAPDAITLLSNFAGRMEEPLRHLL